MKYVGYLLIGILILTGCTLPQKEEMGANTNRNEGFSGFGVAQARNLEGPLSDLMVPDDAPKGLTDPAPQLMREGAYTTGKRNLSMPHEGINQQGPRILNNRPGIIRDKYPHSSDSRLHKKITIQNNRHQQASTDITRKIETRIEALENIHDAHVMSDGNKIIIGLESNEQDRGKLRRSVEQEIEQVTDLSNVYITTNRNIVNRMSALEHHVSLKQPFDAIGGTVGELADLIDDAAHGR
ncbi:YhcN/YlaJ family sporulation lipoprotein [Halalkalibacter kiskunsagensis]|uniref:YhcN/YlaJ family sporulation lipoprotein n=1 Tax=Halalkalibacter kiskunsagensis TaxID=1548599 RepID=A0ABV6KAB5_9BACI